MSCRVPPQGLLSSFGSLGLNRIKYTFFQAGSGDDAGPPPYYFMHPRPSMTFATICSGTEIPAIAVKSCTSMVNELFRPCDFLEELAGEMKCSPFDCSLQQCFLCEKDDEKRAFSIKVADALGCSHMCVCVCSKRQGNSVGKKLGVTVTRSSVPFRVRTVPWVVDLVERDPFRVVDARQ